MSSRGCNNYQYFSFSSDLSRYIQIFGLFLALLHSQVMASILLLERGREVRKENKKRFSLAGVLDTGGGEEDSVRPDNIQQLLNFIFRERPPILVRPFLAR